MVQQPYIGDQGFSDHTLYREGQDYRSDRKSGCVSEYRWRCGCQDQHQAHFQLKFSDQSHLCIAAWLKQIVVPLVNPPPCQPLKMCDLCSWCLWTTRKVQDMLLMSLNYFKSWKPAPGVSEPLASQVFPAARPRACPHWLLARRPLQEQKSNKERKRSK